MATFVLVHGAMHGGWSWREVRERLSSGGHEVACGHDLMLAAPAETAALLETIARQAH
jgi:hypothetical protein